MNYAVLRIMKLKTIQSIAGSGAHIFRLRDTPNADISQKHLNIQVIGEHNQLHKLVLNRIQEGVVHPKARIRKDSVRAVEFILTASPQWFKDQTKEKQKEWVKANANWLKNRYGSKNLVSLVLHMDEQTPHIHAHIVPITADGRLSAKDFFGGSRQTLRDLQSDYASAMSKFDLNRGIKYSKATHASISQYYKYVNLSRIKFKPTTLQKPPLLFGKQAYIEKLEKEINLYRKQRSIFTMETYRRKKLPLVKENDDLTKRVKKITSLLEKQKKDTANAEDELRALKKKHSLEQDIISGLRQQIEELRNKNSKLKSQLKKHKGNNFDYG